MPVQLCLLILFTLRFSLLSWAEESMEINNWPLTWFWQHFRLQVSLHTGVSIRAQIMDAGGDVALQRLLPVEQGEASIQNLTMQSLNPTQGIWWWHLVQYKLCYMKLVNHLYSINSSISISFSILFRTVSTRSIKPAWICTKWMNTAFLHKLSHVAKWFK